MKNLFIFTFILFISSCEKVDEFTQFNLDYNSEVTIPSSTPLSLPFDLITPDMETNSESAFSANDTRKDKVEEIELREAVLTIKSPNNSDFSFLKSIEAYISAEGLPEERIAWKDNVPENFGARLELETSNKNLEEYIKKDEFKVRLKTITDEAISQEHKVNVYTKFFVNAEVLGV